MVDVVEREAVEGGAMEQAESSLSLLNELSLRETL